MNEKVMIFIDGANLFHGCQNYQQGYQIDILKLRDELVGPNRKLIRAYYYGSIPTDDKTKINGQKGFYNFLDYQGFKTNIIPLRSRKETFVCNKCGNTHETTKTIEKGVDIALITDVLTFGIMRYYDTGIIVSGDLDYFKAIEEVQRRGVNIEIAYFKNGGISSEFIRHADKFIDIEKIANKVKK